MTAVLHLKVLSVSSSSIRGRVKLADTKVQIRVSVVEEMQFKVP